MRESHLQISYQNVNFVEIEMNDDAEILIVDKCPFNRIAMSMLLNQFGI